jgi:hypothetical protein
LISEDLIPINHSQLVGASKVFEKFVYLDDVFCMHVL